MRSKKRSKPVSRSLGRMSFGTHSLPERLGSTIFTSDGVIESRDDDIRSTASNKALARDLKPESLERGRPKPKIEKRLLRYYKTIPTVLAARGEHGDSVWIRGVQVKTPIIY